MSTCKLFLTRDVRLGGPGNFRKSAALESSHTSQGRPVTGRGGTLCDWRLEIVSQTIDVFGLDVADRVVPVIGENIVGGVVIIIAR